MQEVARKAAQRIAAQQAIARAAALQKKNAEAAAKRAAEVRARSLAVSGASQAAEMAEARRQRNINITRARREAYEETGLAELPMGTNQVSDQLPERA